MTYTQNNSSRQDKLIIDCENCSGLCCVALYCMKSDGFPANKEAGIPCKHLTSNFRCDIHSNLVSRNMRGCLAYDCFGAGQKVTEKYYPDVTWKENKEKAKEIYEVFLLVYKLHQMAWYLMEALHFITEEPLRACSKSPKQHRYKSQLNHIKGIFKFTLAIFPKPSTFIKPTKTSFYNPSLWNNCEGM